MNHVGFLAALLIAIVTPAITQNKPVSHAFRQAAIQLLRREGVTSKRTRVVSVEWSDAGHWCFGSLRHRSGTLSNGTVDAATKDYHYLAEN